MKSKPTAITATILLLTGIGVVAWLLWAKNEGPSLRDPSVDGSTADSTAPEAEENGMPRRQSPAITAPWTRRGNGTLVGRCLEYGTERAVGGIAIELTASGGPNTVLTCKSRADGTFAFTSVPNFDRWSLRVDAKAPLGSVELPSIKIVENQQTDVGTIYLAPSFVVKGSVVDENGIGIEGVKVEAQRVGASDVRFDVMRLIRELGTDVAAVDTTVTAKNGSFELKKTPPGTYDFLLTSDTHSAQSERNLPITPDIEEKPLRFTMSRGFELEGRVVRKDGGSPAKIRVVAVISPGEDDSVLFPTKLFTETNDVGQFKFPCVPGGSLAIGAAVPDRPIQLIDDVGIPQTSFVELVIGGEAIVFGRVVDDESRPIGDAEVSLVVEDDSPTFATARTAEDGTYEIRGLPAHNIEFLVVKAPGFAAFPDDMMAFRRTSVETPPEKLKPGRNERNVTLKRGATVRGVVKAKESDRPIEGAHVTIIGTASMLTGTPTAMTGADGRFEIRGVGQGPAIVAAAKDGYVGVDPMTAMTLVLHNIFSGENSSNDERPPGAIDIKTSDAEIEVTIELTAAPILAGRVVDAEGRSVKGARVRAQPHWESVGMPEIIANATGTILGASRFSDADGRFEIPATAFDGQVVEVVADAHGFVASKSSPLPTASGQRVNDITVVMRKGGTVDGRVVGEDGRPMAGARIQWIPNGEEADPDEWDRMNRRWVTSKDDGTFTLTSINPGSISLRATKRGVAAALSHGIVVGEGSTVPVTLTMSTGLAITGRVVDADDRPISRVKIVVMSTDDGAKNPWSGASDEFISAADGSFEIYGLPFGDFELHAWEGSHPPPNPVSVRAGTSGVRIVFPKSMKIRGRVFANGLPAAGVHVSAMDESNRENGSFGQDVSDADGMFTINRLAPGNYTISAVPRESSTSPVVENLLERRVSGIAAGTEDLRIDLEQGVGISGTVTIVGGGVIDGEEVRVDSLAEIGPLPGSSSSVRRSGKVVNGRFEVHGLPPGPCLLQVDVQGFKAKSVRVTAPAHDVIVTVGGGAVLSGRVVLKDGRTPQDAWIFFNDDKGSQEKVRAGADGTYTIRGLEPGRYRCTAWSEKNSGTLEQWIEVPASGAVNVPDIVVVPRASDD